MIRAGRAEHQIALGVKSLDRIMKHMVQVHTKGLGVLYVEGSLQVHEILENLIESTGLRYRPRQYLAKVNGS